MALVRASPAWGQLGELVTISNETRDPRDGDTATFNYIEIGAVGIGTNTYEIVEVPSSEAPSRARMAVRSGDVLLSTTRPDRGAIARVRPEHDGSIASTGFAVLRGPALIKRDAAFEVLQTEVVKLQLRQRSHGGAYPAITLEQLGLIELPKLTGERRVTLLAELDTARAARDAGLLAAEALLSGIDTFVLDALGLTLPPPHDPERSFATRLSDLMGSRFGADFFSPRFKALRSQVETGKFQALNLGEICLPLRSGFAAGADSQSDKIDGIPHLRPTNISGHGELTDSGMKYVPQESVVSGGLLTRGEVLFNNTNSSTWVGKSAVFDRETLSACSNHVTRLRLSRSEDSPAYLAAVLNAFRALGYFSVLSTNFNNQAGINAETLGAVAVPLPDAGEQTAIAAEVDRRRAEAKRLRAEARAGWNAARARFEEALLEPAT